MVNLDCIADKCVSPKDKTEKVRTNACKRHMAPHMKVPCVFLTWFSLDVVVCEMKFPN